MNRLMKADLKRIIAKPSMYVIVLILVLLVGDPLLSVLC